MLGATGEIWKLSLSREIILKNSGGDGHILVLLSQMITICWRKF